MQITVPLPLNIASENMYLFEPYWMFELSRQNMKRFKNVFVTNSGFCLNSKGLIKECHHNHPYQYADYQSDAERYYFDVTDQPENLVILDSDNTYLFIHHPWFNYYNWICKSVFRLWIVRHQLDKLILVLPEYCREADFIKGSLEPFQIKNIYFIHIGKSILVKNLCLPQIKPVCDSHNAQHLEQVCGFYKRYVFSKPEMPKDEIEKLYVSRRFVHRRKVIDEAEIITLLKRYGVTIFYPEHFSFLQQVVICAKVKYLVGKHGSGLTNLLFMQKRTSVLELHKDE